MTSITLTNINKIQLDLSKSDFIELIRDMMTNFSEFDELYKRKELIKIICTDLCFDVNELQQLFSEIIESIKSQQE